MLQYQVDSRLTGMAPAQVAPDLALIRIADRNPQAALRALNQTRIGEISRGFLSPLALIGASAGLTILEPAFCTAATACGLGLHMHSLPAPPLHVFFRSLLDCVLALSGHVIPNPHPPPRPGHLL